MDIGKIEFDDRFYRPAKRPDMGIPQDVDDAIEYHKRKIGDKDHRALIAQMIQDTEAMRKSYEARIEGYRDLIAEQAKEIERLKKRSARWKKLCGFWRELFLRELPPNTFDHFRIYRPLKTDDRQTD